MKVLIKKEVRLLLPAWIVAVLLAMVQGITRPYDFYVVSLLFFGLTIMALSTIGRESSLNTFSSVLAQPTERIRTWQVKLSVLAAAFLTVFLVWLVAYLRDGCIFARRTWAGPAESLPCPSGNFYLPALLPGKKCGRAGPFLRC
jgi:hypothetical protein